MRVLCLYVEHLAAAVETRAHPDLVGKPVVIGGLPHERKPVFDCSAEAIASGIMPGLPLREAHHLCPEAVFLPQDEPRYSRAFGDVLAIVDRFSPAVELETPGKAFMDASGLGNRFGGEEMLAGQVLSEVSSRTGLHPTIGLGNSKFVAEVAARLSAVGQFSTVEEGDERDFLAPVPVELLPVSEETRDRLKLLGLHTLGQVSFLPPDALVSQFGQEGLLAHQLASGIDSRPVVPRTRPAILEDELSVESPLESVESVMAAFGILLDRLLPELWARGQVCGRLQLRVGLDGDSTWQELLNLKRPTSSKREILARIQHRLERLQLPGGIWAVYMTLAELVSEPTEQSSLLGSGGSKQEAAIGQAARQLRARLGKSLLKKVAVLDPGSRIPERRVGLVDFPNTDE